MTSHGKSLALSPTRANHAFFSGRIRHTKLERLKQLLQQREELEQSLDEDEAAMDKLYMTMAEKLQIALDARLENLA